VDEVEKAHARGYPSSKFAKRKSTVLIPARSN
jgi:hypothetical protein